MGTAGTYTVKVKWSKQTFDDVTIDTTEAPQLFKSQLWTLTGVPPARQTILGFKGGKLRDEADWSTMGLRNGMTIMLMGTPDGSLPPAPAADQLANVKDDLDADAADMDIIQPVGPPGLTNLGNTCYMNASVQCLRAVTPLVSTLNKYDGLVAASDPGERFVATLRDVMRELGIPGESVTPFTFLSALRAINPQFAERGQHGMYMQQDAEECWGEILTRLAGSLLMEKGRPEQGNYVDRMFGIQMKSVDQCTEADDEEAVERGESVRALKCHISVNVNHLTQGIREGLEETIEKHSERLGKTAKWKRTARMDQIPPYLIVQFVRFFWKPAERVKAKILRNVSFPVTLDVFEFCTDELKTKLSTKRDEAMAKADRAVEEETDGETTEQTGGNEDLVAETGNYELCAVLTHQGRAADAGHYVAWVKDVDTRWYKFDDSKVSTHTEEEVKKLSGGGDWPMAYMCLYRAKNSV